MILGCSPTATYEAALTADPHHFHQTPPSARNVSSCPFCACRQISDFSAFRPTCLLDRLALLPSVCSSLHLSSANAACFPNIQPWDAFKISFLPPTASTAELAFISGVTVLGGPDEPTLLGVHHLQAASNPISPPTDPAFASSIVPTASRASAPAASENSITRSHSSLQPTP